MQAVIRVVSRLLIIQLFWRAPNSEFVQTWVYDTASTANALISTVYPFQVILQMPQGNVQACLSPDVAYVPRATFILLTKVHMTASDNVVIASGN